MLVMPEVSSQPNQPASSPVQPEQSKGISWKKISVSVGLIAVVAGIIAGGLYWYFVQNEEEATTTGTTKVTTPSSKPATPSAEKDETADWKTFTDSTGSFSIKYPKEYTEVPIKADTVFGTEIRSADYKVTDNPEPKLVSGSSISVFFYYPSEQPPTLETLKEDKEGDSGTIISTTKAKVAGVEALKFIWNPFTGLADEQIDLSFVKGEKAYSLGIAAEESNRDELNAVFEKMVSTFKFLD
jgi:hypothetical protein